MNSTTFESKHEALDRIELTPKQARAVLSAKRAADLLRENAAKVDATGAFPRENIRALGRAGILALPVPESHGGAGADMLAIALVVEELAKHCASTAMCTTMHLSTVPIIGALAKGEQVERFIGPILRGEWYGASATSEFASGSRVWHSQGFAEPTEDGYLLTADKSFVTGSGEADFYLVPVRNARTADPADLSLFVVENAIAPTRGLSQWDAMGFRGTSSSPVRFDAVPLPRHALLGDAGAGFDMIVCFHLPIYHVCLSAVFLGIAQAALADAIAHVQGRVHADTRAPLASVETVQRYIGEMKIEINRTRALLARVARMTDRALKVMTQIAEIGLAKEVTERLMKNDDFFTEVAALKVACTECAVRVSDRAMQVCGGAGYKRGHSVERHYRDARAGAVMAPNNDSILLLVGKQLLGYPFPWDEDRARRNAS